MGILTGLTQPNPEALRAAAGAAGRYFREFRV